MPKTSKRTTLDISPTIKKRIERVAKSNGKGLNVTASAILEHALPDFESGRVRIQTAVVPAESHPLSSTGE